MLLSKIMHAQKTHKQRLLMLPGSNPRQSEIYANTCYSAGSRQRMSNCTDFGNVNYAVDVAWEF